MDLIRHISRPFRSSVAISLTHLGHNLDNWDFNTLYVNFFYTFDVLDNINSERNVNQEIS